MNYLEKNIKNFTKDLKKLISFETYLKKEYPNQEMKDALNFLGELAKENNMKYFIDPNGYYGYIEIGQGEELIGLLTHVDVVPPGDLKQWKSEPFDLKIIGDHYFGRGVSDDKGPLMLMFYLLKEFKNKNLNKRIRLIFPTDEENDWRGVEKYNELEEKINFGITPDSMFPATFLEREILQFDLKTKPVDFIINSGSARNVVPGKAIYKNKDEEIESIGKSAHAMDPKQGENSIHKLFKNLKNLKNPLIDFINKEINFELNGKTLFSKVLKDEYGEITVNNGIAEFNENIARVTFDMRLPHNINGSEIKQMVLEKISKYKDIEFVDVKNDKKVFIPKESNLIKELTSVYKEVTGTLLEPIVMGGGTYAKSMDNIIAFGPLLPNSPHTEHKENENINIKEYFIAYDIYKKLLENWSLKK